MSANVADAGDRRRSDRPGRGRENYERGGPRIDTSALMEVICRDEAQAGVVDGYRGG